MNKKTKGWRIEPSTYAASFSAAVVLAIAATVVASTSYRPQPQNYVSEYIMKGVFNQ